GNNELQYYREDNTSVSDGYLTIEARKESFNGRSYTSSRLTTEDKFDFNYGRVDIRARLPEGQGIWPALWMLGANFRSVGWPSCGEIDIMELIGGGDGRDDVVYGTAHWDNDGTKADFGGNTQLSSGKFSDQFHVFTIIWDANSITWFLNDQQFHTMDITPTALSELRNNFFLIFNVAVGGNWPGSPNATTTFPQRMFVDYIRVFQDE
ncbi:MAG: glycoside hydrolase family 16 protein, partial [Ekhidna sp.]